MKNYFSSWFEDSTKLAGFFCLFFQVEGMHKKWECGEKQKGSKLHSHSFAAFKSTVHISYSTARPTAPIQNHKNKNLPTATKTQSGAQIQNQQQTGQTWQTRHLQRKRASIVEEAEHTCAALNSCPSSSTPNVTCIERLCYKGLK